MDKPIIGLEIHVELKTKSKMFCSCLNNSNERHPNVNICPICTAQPGTLPVINIEAVRKVIKTGLALNCQIPEYSRFDRKNYFYPDLPKGYQISQYDMPLCEKGHLIIKGRKIRVRRVHLEEDTGKLIHEKDYSLVDFNRAGVPLMELVTEPDIQSPQEARQFAQELQMILRYLEVSNADMEKGQMRVEANVSLATENSKFGPKVEIKNLNSFKALERALEYEIQRQKDCLESAEEIIQETRGWDEGRQKTFSQRGKEEAQDYRYFPEPDLPPLFLSRARGPQITKPSVATIDIESIRAALPELPQAKRERFKKEYGISDLAIDVLVAHKELGEFFEEAASELGQTEYDREKIDKARRQKLHNLLSNYIVTEFPKYLRDRVLEKVTPENFAELIVLIEKGIISSSGAQIVLKEMFATGADPTHIIEEKNLAQVSDEAEIEKIVELVIKNNPQPVEDYKKGKETALQFLVGQVMRETKGKANPQIVSDILKKKL